MLLAKAWGEENDGIGEGYGLWDQQQVIFMFFYEKYQSRGVIRKRGTSQQVSFCLSLNRICRLNKYFFLYLSPSPVPQLVLG